MSSVAALGRRAAKKDIYFTTEAYDDAVDELSINPVDSIATFNTIFHNNQYPDDDAKTQQSRMKEESFYHLIRYYANQGDFETLRKLMDDVRVMLDDLTKPRGAKVLRTAFDLIQNAAAVHEEAFDRDQQKEMLTTLQKSTSLTPNNRPALTQITDIASNATIDIADDSSAEAYAKRTHKVLVFVIELIQNAIVWCETEKRLFLKQRLQARLAQLYADTKQYGKGLTAIRRLMKEIQKIDDKPLIVELQLLEAMIYFTLRNYPKSRGALTLARATACSFYCPAHIAAQLELRAGMLSCRENDYATAESYFHEAKENLSVLGYVKEASIALKYGLFCKIMSNNFADVHNMIQQEPTEYINNHIVAIEELSNVYQKRQYQSLSQLLVKYPLELASDPLISDQLTTIRSGLLEEQIKKILAPYSRVDIAFLIAKLDLEHDVIHGAICELILDNKLHATIDNNTGDIVLMDKPKKNELLDNCEASIEHMNKVVTLLSDRLQKLKTISEAPAPVVAAAAPTPAPAGIATNPN